MQKILLVLALLVAAVSGRMAGILPGGFRIERGFSCEGRDYGFYADVSNDCKAYHLCHPVFEEDGQLVEMAHFSFLCGPGSVFDQTQLACSHPRKAFPCAEAESVYEDSNFRLRVDADQYES